MRAIDADAMLVRLEEWNTSDTTDKALYNFTMHRINEQPTIEPELIRCKDCKWKQGSECVRFAEVRPFPDDFCSRAERKQIYD